MHNTLASIYYSSRVSIIVYERVASRAVTPLASPLLSSRLGCGFRAAVSVVIMHTKYT